MVACGPPVYSVSVRVIAATNRNAGRPRAAQIARGPASPASGRSDEVRRCAARRRRASSANHFRRVNRAAKEPKTFAESTLARLEQYYWPARPRALQCRQRAYIVTTEPVISDRALDGRCGRREPVANHRLECDSRFACDVGAAPIMHTSAPAEPRTRRRACWASARRRCTTSSLYESAATASMAKLEPRSSFPNGRWT